VLEKEGMTGRIISAAIELHRELGPGLLESANEECLCRELVERGLLFERQRELPIMYKGSVVDGMYRLDLVVEGSVIIELKAVEVLAKIHEAQLLTYMRMSGIRIGLLINFNAALLKDGIKRFIK
jgi:GxxExxY protein